MAGIAAGLARCYVDACLLELRALKPGNAHVHAAGHRIAVGEMETSARVSAGPLTQPGAPVGRRILDAVSATDAAVGSNTNLGIVLLAAPLLVAAEIAAGDLREGLHQVLARLTVEDAAAAYAAIRLASPAGLGAAPEQDVAAPPTADLRAVMSLAADRDRVARQYATGYDDVYLTGIPELAAAQHAQQPPEWGATRAFMAFLAAFPDSHIQRKHGQAVAEQVRAEAVALHPKVSRGPDDRRAIEALLAFDGQLKARGLNPGTSADLTVASALAFTLST
ncbi:MAG TPA: triphosphoribosyl-dephospho-CoA synthase [Alphaproteobacteria bacterium]|nr:triphosphoribosyl-dephospho-CoA synthase [Alphaproteobacteria bacterium]